MLEAPRIVKGAESSLMVSMQESPMSDILSNSLGMEMVLLPAGSFTMGGDWEAEQADENELPRHAVIFEAPFYMGRFAVTQDQWQAVMGNNPSEYKGLNHPVETVAHDEAAAFVRRLNAKEDTRTYRLPTEAEWEYAARAGSQSTYCFGFDVSRLSEYAWFQINSDGRTHPVGQLAANDWGLHDMHGNVHEWCADWFHRAFYAESPSKHPAGPSKGVARVLRGGDWGSEAWYCRSAIRSLSSPQRRSPRVGFRVVKDLEESLDRRKSRGLLRKLFSTH
jgi:formylglycine-generating enzyme required for sulfatase activity